MGTWIKQFALCLMVATLGITGCGKKQTGPPPSAPVDVAGVKVDLPKLQAEFDNAAPELKGLATDATSAIRYGLYDKTLMALDKLSTSPGLTDSQKETVNTVIEQMKQVVAKAGATK